MRFGLFFLPLASTQTETRAEYNRMLTECVEAEELGFNEVWFTEHHFDRYGGIMPSPFVMMAAAARMTRRLRLGTAVSVLPLNDPIRLAEEAAMVDVLSDGRVDIGLGRGFLPHEFAAIAMDDAQRNAKVHDGWWTLKTIWNDEAVSFRGESVRFNSLRLLPRPKQSPHPPLWMAASVTQSSFEVAGRFGFHLMLNPYNRTKEELDRGLTTYRAAAEAAGFAWATRRVLVNFPLFVGPSTHAAHENAKAAFQGYLATMEAAFRKNGATGRISSGDYEAIAAKVLFGSPDDLVTKLRAWQEWGATDVCLMTRFADLPYEAAQRSRALFAERVAPHFA